MPSLRLIYRWCLAFTLRIALRLRWLLPRSQRLQRLERACWDRFWVAEEEEERRELGAEAPTSPIVGSERAVFIETIASCWPFRSVLEVGCGYGQNAHILSELFPGIRYVGIDTDQQRVEEGQRLLEQSKSLNAKFIQSDVRDLSGFTDKSVEITISAACLLYVEEGDIHTAVSEMTRVSRRAVIILEQDDPNGGEQGVLVTELGRPGYWVRNYLKVFSEHCSDSQLSRYPVPNPRWQLERWSSLATVIRVSMSGN